MVFGVIRKNDSGWRKSEIRTCNFPLVAPAPPDTRLSRGEGRGPRFLLVRLQDSSREDGRTRQTFSTHVHTCSCRPCTIFYPKVLHSLTGPSVFEATKNVGIENGDDGDVEEKQISSG
ncbi:hypothetical protein GN956_G18614 [Arapaima gigas]